MKHSKYSILIIICISIISCKNNNENWETTDDGVKYKIFRNNVSEKKPVPNNVLQLYMQYSSGETVFFNSINDVGEKFRMKLRGDEGATTFDKMMLLLSEGDSMDFKMNALQFMKESNQPDLIPKATDDAEILFNIRLQKIISAQEYKDEREILTQKNKTEEMEKLEEYIAKEGITTQPTQSGMYYIETKAGTGKTATAGKTIKAHYTGMLINGQVFDSSLKRNELFEFTLGIGHVITGWDEGFSYMKEGGKARLIIPSHLAYGENGFGDIIPPYATLVFDIELIEVVD